MCFLLLDLFQIGLPQFLSSETPYCVKYSTKLKNSTKQKLYRLIEKTSPFFFSSLQTVTRRVPV